jgi:hypothetical protein
MKSPNKIFIKRRTFWVIILPISAITTVILGVVVFLFLNSGSAKLRDYKRILEQSGETLDIATLAPQAAAEENSAGEFLAAIKELSSAAKEIPSLLPGKNADSEGTAPLLADAPEPQFKKDGDRGTWEEAQAQYDPLDPLLRKVREVSKSPVIETQPDFHLGFEMPIEGLGDSLKTSSVLAGDGLLKLRQENAAAVIDDIEAILQIARVFQKQPLIISQMLSRVSVDLARKLTWSLLQEHIATEQELSRLQTLWTEVDLLSSLVATLRMERACGALTFGFPAKKFATTMESAFGLDDSSKETKQNISLLAWTWKIAYRNDDELLFLESYQRLIDAAKTARDSGNWKPFTDATDSITSYPPTLIVSRLTFISVASALTQILETQALTELTIAAIALERYASTEIGHPSTLEELVPEYLASVPIDPFDGRPVRYQASTSGAFSLYSVGINGSDDQGDASPLANPRQQRDIVWPRPQPVEEPAQ